MLGRLLSCVFILTLLLSMLSFWLYTLLRYMMGPQWRVLGYSSYTYTCNLLALATQGKIKEHWLPATWQAIWNALPPLSLACCTWATACVLRTGLLPTLPLHRHRSNCHPVLLLLPLQRRQPQWEQLLLLMVPRPSRRESCCALSLFLCATANATQLALLGWALGWLSLALAACDSHGCVQGQKQEQTPSGLYVSRLHE